MVTLGYLADHGLRVPLPSLSLGGETNDRQGREGGDGAPRLVGVSGFLGPRCGARYRLAKTPEPYRTALDAGGWVGIIYSGLAIGR